ncbi:PREDICTED: pyroglutamyl-peptidase 1-like protein isoform X2 [Chinchilla lanigera]|nr:PREDICTED: pyroglutamyl-peptidase 1-like protein isoform X2 [Chinchilla lanigera]
MLLVPAHLSFGPWRPFCARNTARGALSKTPTQTLECRVLLNLCLPVAGSPHIQRCCFFSQGLALQPSPAVLCLSGRGPGVRRGRPGWEQRCLPHCSAWTQTRSSVGSMDSQSSCVVVTGFGPFRQHLVNSSWEAVKELSKLGLETNMEVELRTLQLPVDYREVKQRVTRIWEEFQPQLAVHVGVDTSAKAIFLEQCGKNRGYRDRDIRGFQPEEGVCLPGGRDVIVSRVNMKAVCKHIAIEDVEVTFSGDAGRYICDYTYYLSLHHGNGHAALIHVPPLSRGFPASLLGKALQVIIQEMLEASGKAQAHSQDCRELNRTDSTQREPVGKCLL